MLCNSIFCDSSMIRLFAYCASEYHRLFPAAQGLLENFLRKIKHAFLEQQDDRRAAEAEQTFLLAAADNACLSVVFNLPDEACTDLDLHNGTEIFGVQHAVFTSVLHKHGPFAHYYRLHGMIAPLNVPVAAFEAVVDVAIAVVIPNAKPQYEAGAVYVIVCDIRTAYKILDAVIAVFYRKLGGAAYFLRRHVSVRRRAKHATVGVERTRVGR